MTRDIRIEGVTLTGDTVASFVLPHGADPSEQLQARGWNLTGVTHAFTPPGSDGVTIRLAVVAEVDGGDRHTTWALTATGEILPDGVEPIVVQRIAAYAVIPRGDETLLTRLAPSVRGAAGRWTLPGGGIDRGEDPSVAVRREVWEETGQHLGEIHLLDVSTSHWIGQAPSGEWEDYQVVRLVYAATVPHPGPLVVHDAGGTTAECAWIADSTLAEEERAPLLRGGQWLSWRAAADGRWPRERQ